MPDRPYTFTFLQSRRDIVVFVDVHNTPGSGPEDDLRPTNIWLVVWLSGNALASINIVALRQTRLVPGWVTVCGRVNHLGM